MLVLKSHCKTMAHQNYNTRARAISTEDAFFQLPEIGFGLIPGSGGTASLTRRIGRYETALLALTGRTISADKALDLGLVDEIRSG